MKMLHEKTQPWSPVSNFTFKIPKRTNVLVLDNNTNTEFKNFISVSSTFGPTNILPLFLVVLHVAQICAKDRNVLTGG